MEVLASAFIPRRISQIYADTKRSYEQIVRNNVPNPQLSSLHLKLRIQKDRLIAWGLEWADANAAQSGDIDDSLDRAGISDLVVSIMSSIRELLDEAERIQPTPQTMLPGSYPPEKTGLLNYNPWTPIDVARLGDIVKDITTSIDTLCDLSRSQQAQRQSKIQKDEKPTNLAAKTIAMDARSKKSSGPGTPNSETFPLLPDSSSIISSSRIDPQNLTFVEMADSPGTQPPPYDSVASSPSDRAFAILRSSSSSQSVSNKATSSETFVCVDYGQEFDSDVAKGKLPSLKRYESLVLALQAANADSNQDNYTGCLRIMGWFADRRRCRFGFVYEIPRTNPTAPILNGALRRPQTLMSYLQHGGDTDSANMPCLEDRFRLGFNLAANLLHTHAKGVLHRNINSNNIVFLEDDLRNPESKPWKEGVIRKPFLLSWDQSGDDSEASTPEMLVSSIYRHPKVDRGKRSKYRPAYDIYSLGLILLEIGIWMPIHKFWKSKYTLSDFQKRLQTVYASKLAAKCGNNYMRAAHYCLTIADSPSYDGSPMRHSSVDGQHARLQTDFYWNVLKPLEKCCMLDESNEPILVPASSVAPERPFANLETGDDLERSSRSLLQPSDISHLPESGPTPEKRLKTDSPFHADLKSDLLVWSHKVPNATRAYFETVMMPKLGKMFARAIDRWESYEIDIFMAGDTPETAKPTLLMVCRSIMRAWKILEYVNNDQNLFDIRVASGQIHYSKNNKKRRKPKNIVTPASQSGSQASQSPSKYQQKPVCGASIGAFVDEQHLEAVTFGGIVLVDGEPYGMSVHHMLEDQDDDRGLNYVLDDPEETPNTIESNEGSQYLDDDELDADFFDQDFDDDEQCFNLGDTLGTQPGKGRDIVVTQPALDDVDPQFFPNEEDMSDDHLSSHGLGYIHASSGLKQVRHGNLSHEVDWVLFKVAEGRLHPHNVVTGGERFVDGADTSPQPCGVMRADTLGDRGVHAKGSKSGLAEGRIWSCMTMTKMPGRVFPSPVWRFQGGFGGMHNCEGFHLVSD